MNATLIPLTPTKDGPPGTWEQIAGDALRMRRIVELLTQGRSYHQIADELGIAYTTMLRIAPRVPEFINDETRALAQMWQGIEFARLEAASARLLPNIIGDDCDDPPDPKDLAAYLRLVATKMAVLTLNRQKLSLGEDIRTIDDDSAEEKAQVVGRFVELADKLVGDMIDRALGASSYATETASATTIP